MPAFERKKKLLSAEAEQPCDMLIDSEELEEDDENESQFDDVRASRTRRNSRNQRLQRRR